MRSVFSLALDTKLLVSNSSQTLRKRRLNPRLRHLYMRFVASVCNKLQLNEKPELEEISCS